MPNTQLRYGHLRSLQGTEPWCTRRDLNPHAPKNTGPSSQGVCQFRHSCIWCGQRDSNPTSHLRRRLLRPLCLPTAYTPAYRSAGFWFPAGTSHTLRRSITTWYTRRDSNPHRLSTHGPEPCVSSNSTTGAYKESGQPVKRIPRKFVCYAFSLDKSFRALMAPDAGLEPTNLGSEPSVLPLD